MTDDLRSIWTIDTDRSELRFTARQMAMTVRGRFPGIEGRLTLDLERLEASEVEATVDAASVEPAMGSLRGLLLSDSFLGAAENPTLTFRSSAIEPDGDHYLVRGRLTFRGEERDIELDARLASIDLAGEQRSVVIEARGRIDHLMSDEELEVELSIRAVPGSAVETVRDTRPATTATTATPVTSAAPGAVRPQAAQPSNHRAVASRDEPIRIVALVGSLRRGSLNRALLHAAQEAAPGSVEIETFSLAEVPFYDGDLEAEGDPVAVRALKSAIRDADALLIVTPEYNRGLPATIKNAIDWASRPPFASPLAGKPVLLMGASSGRSGARYALQHADAALTHARAVPYVERFEAARLGDHVDDDGRVTDPAIHQQLRELLHRYQRFVINTAAQQSAAA